MAGQIYREVECVGEGEVKSLMRIRNNPAGRRKERQVLKLLSTAETEF